MLKIIVVIWDFSIDNLKKIKNEYFFKIQLIYENIALLTLKGRKKRKEWRIFYKMGASK